MNRSPVVRALADTFAAMTDEGIREVVRRHLQPRLDATGLTQQDVRDRDSLTQTGVLDSFALMELLAGVERELGIELDFGSLAVEDLTTLAGLGRAFASALQR